MGRGGQKHSSKPSIYFVGCERKEVMIIYRQPDRRIESISGIIGNLKKGGIR